MPNNILQRTVDDYHRLAVGCDHICSIGEHPTEAPTAYHYALGLRFVIDEDHAVYYHLRYHLWAGVHRDSSGTNSTTTERKAHRRDQTGPDGTQPKHGTPRYESEGRRFESCRARPSNSCSCRILVPARPSLQP